MRVMRAVLEVCALVTLMDLMLHQGLRVPPQMA
jgi:hypothetical protein